MILGHAINALKLQSNKQKVSRRLQNERVSAEAYKLEARGPRWHAERKLVGGLNQFQSSNRFDLLADSLTN